eukprot:6214397-Pyramimonas_sp.AAC.1
MATGGMWKSLSPRVATPPFTKPRAPWPPWGQSLSPAMSPAQLEMGPAMPEGSSTHPHLEGAGRLVEPRPCRWGQ